MISTNAGPEESATPINAAAQQSDQWRRVSLLARWTNSRRVRRLVVVAWFAVLALCAALTFKHLHLSSSFFFLPVLPFALAAVAFERMEKSLTHPTLEDRAALQYCEDFDALKENQRHAVLDQQVRDNLLGAEHADARETDLRAQAEARAYRILYRAILALMLIAACASPWMPNVSPRDINIAIAILAWLILVLPMLIRIWTTPDRPTDLGSPQIVDTCIVDKDSPH